MVSRAWALLSLAVVASSGCAGPWTLTAAEGGDVLTTVQMPRYGRPCDAKETAPSLACALTLVKHRWSSLEVPDDPAVKWTRAGTLAPLERTTCLVTTRMPDDTAAHRQTCWRLASGAKGVEGQLTVSADGATWEPRPGVTGVAKPPNRVYVITSGAAPRRLKKSWLLLYRTPRGYTAGLFVKQLETPAPSR